MQVQVLSTSQVQVQVQDSFEVQATSYKLQALQVASLGTSSSTSTGSLGARRD